MDYLLSTAARFIYHLKGNLRPDTVWEIPSMLNYHVRYLFWITYICDKGFCLVTGLAPVLDDLQCHLDFVALPPDRIIQTDTGPHIFGDPVPGSYVHTYVHLAVIQSRILRNLYSPGVIRQSHADLLRSIRDLDHSLEQWKNSIPLVNRPSFLQLPGSSSQKTDMTSSIFHLQYHHCMMMIHQASSRCPSWEQNQNTHDTSSSLAISVIASRNLLAAFLYSRFELNSQNLL
ncbi:hypothetical protein N7528_002104 [Penicillium herquei]|nr:hypothetical protein N7528_002104 [Penicillium herquei]